MFTMVQENTCLNSTELKRNSREWGLIPKQVHRWPQADQDGNAQPLQTVTDPKGLQKRHHEAQRKIERSQQELRHKDKALVEAAVQLIV